jgi:VIT1/CCC1 family predicted Fe2+/Mn2+ transporter
LPLRTVAGPGSAPPPRFWFGFIKRRFTTNRPLRSAWQTVLVGGLAASATFAIAKLIG